MKNPVLVTAASGMVGQHVVKELAVRGTRVKAMVYDMNEADDLRLPNVEVFWGDLRDEDGVRSAVMDVDKVYLITPLAKDMVAMTERVVEAAQDAGVRAIVRQSFFGAEQGRTTAHLLHRECEKVLDRSQIEHTIIRPNQLMQNFAKFFGAAIKEKGELRRPVSGGRTSFIDAQDVGRAAAYVLDGNWQSGKKYCLTGPAALSDAEVATELGKTLGKQVRPVDVEEDEALETLLEVTGDEWRSKAILEVLRLEKASFLSTVTNDLRVITGQAPRTFQDYARTNLPLFRDQP